ncbi:MAG: MotA/TolQ/ExbB proton channel family protein [Bacteroidales bacterium]|nr:MotA/TolQ/ExbB proton channel family protein [Bacteroidales bacterium]MCF8328396.1 MotA/TolQ/ExbB proton channel family protein [Bacteroidales bacterium]
MKKLIAFLALAGVLNFAALNTAFAQDADEMNKDTAETEQVDTTAADTTAAAAGGDTSLDEMKDAEKEEQTFHQVLKEKFIEGGAGFMGIVLLTLILGLALVIERILYLNLATTNTDKLLSKFENALDEGGVDAAKDLMKNTRGPVASIFYEGLSKMDEGIETVEKAVSSYGSVVMARLEKGLSWISLFIAIAPMLGFMGTVIGMIGAFDAIEAAGDISPTVVAGGIKVALLTTVFGLIVGIILQIFYNYLVSKVDSLVNDMEDSTISFIDILVKKQNK